MTWKSEALLRISAALLVQVVGGLVALACARGDFMVWQAAWKMACWKCSLITGMEILAAIFMAHGLAMLLAPLCRGPFRLPGFWLGKALALFPVNCLAWAFLGWWIGQLGHPVWTLMPSGDAAHATAGADSVAIVLWTWVPAVALLVVPLTGQCLSLSLERSAQGRDAGLSMLGLLGLMLVIPVEDALGIEGAGSLLARVLRQPGNAASDASAAWVVTGTLMHLAVCLHLPARNPQRSERASVWSVRSVLSACLKFSAWLCLARFLLQGIFDLSRDKAGSSELFAAFDQPSVMLGYGTTALLCALSFWMLGHIIRPRPQSSPLS